MPKKVRKPPSEKLADLETRVRNLENLQQLTGVAVHHQYDTYLLLKMQYSGLEERLLWACNVLEQLKKTVTDSRKYSEQRFDTLEQRFDTLEQRFDTLEQRFDTLAERLDSNEKTLDDRIESAVTRALNKKFN